MTYFYTVRTLRTFFSLSHSFSLSLSLFFFIKKLVSAKILRNLRSQRYYVRKSNNRLFFVIVYIQKIFLLKICNIICLIVILCHLATHCYGQFNKLLIVSVYCLGTVSNLFIIIFHAVENKCSVKYLNILA